MILIEIVEEAARSDRMPGDFEIVNVAVPVVANRVDGRHAEPLYYRGSTRRLLPLPHDPRPRSSHRPHLRPARRRRRHLRSGDRLRRGAARPGGGADRARRLRERQLVQSSADDSRRAALPADARPPARARIGARADARSRASRRTPSGPCPSRCRSIGRCGPARRRCGPGSCSIASSPSTGTRGVVPALRLPAGRVVSRSEAAQRFPGLRRQGLTGAAVWSDYITAESDRLTFSFAMAAAEHGAVLANYVEAVSPLTDGKRVTGVRARDRQTGREFEIGARLTVNATGAAVDTFLAPLGISTQHAAVEGDESRDAPRSGRRGARRTHGVRPPPVSRPVARPRADRARGSRRRRWSRRRPARRRTRSPRSSAS